MQAKLINTSNGSRTFAVILETGDEVMSCLGKFVVDESISAAQITAIGAFREAVLAYFDFDKKDYVQIPVQEQVEVASMIGDVALDPQHKPTLHIHLVLGKRDGTALAGHLNKGYVRPTLEVIINESPGHLQKVYDQETGLALIRR